MALRERLRSFLGRSEGHKDALKETMKEEDGSSFSTSAVESITKTDDARDITEFDATPDEEVIDGIEEIYYSGSTFDATEYELQRLQEQVDLTELEAMRDKLRRQHQAVSRQLSKKILDNQGAYVRELERVIDLQASLQRATSICNRGRRSLLNAKQEATLGALTILARNRRKLLLHRLLKSLRFIKTLQQTDVRLKELLEEDDYPRAIQLCLECQKTAVNFKQYKCISELSSNLQETLDQIEEQLDVALSKVCTTFCLEQYERLQSAYKLLGKTQIAMDQLQMHYLNTVNNVALQVVYDHVKGDVAIPHIAQDLNFQALCKEVAQDDFITCLTDLCTAVRKRNVITIRVLAEEDRLWELSQSKYPAPKSRDEERFWKIMYSYHLTMKWHGAHDSEPRKDITPGNSPPPVISNQDDKGTFSKDQENDSKINVTFDHQYIKSKLDQGLRRIWEDVQQKVKIYVLSTDLSYFKYDGFILVLDIINRLIQIGEEFCGSRSQGLQESVRVQTVNYFKAYHRATLDELRMFLENDAWELCPVQANFSILNLQEFHFFRPNVGKGHRRTPSGQIKTDLGFLNTYNDEKSPFSKSSFGKGVDDTQDGNGSSNTTEKMRQYEDDDYLEDEDDVADELKWDYVDEKTGDEGELRNTAPKKRVSQISQKTPIVTNTTLNVLRSFGKYMQMMTVLKPIAFDVVICMSQLFDYYLYTVYIFFGSGGRDLNPEPDTVSNELSPKMRMTLKRIYEKIILKDDAMPSPTDLKVSPPSLAPFLNLSDTEELFGLSHRLIAVESLIFLANQLNFLHNNLDALIPVAKRAFLAQFYSQTIDVTKELRIPVYNAVAEKAIDFEYILQLMSNVKWDIKDIMSQHSSYVDNLVQEFQSFEERLAKVSRLVPIPKEASCQLWTDLIQLANVTFVDGFSVVKKCSNEGRALMQLDFQQFLMKLERLSPVRPIPGREFVEAYVKAFYLNESDLEKWIKEHTEYSIKQLSGLVTCGVGSHITKKARSRLLGVLEEMDRSKTR